MELTRGEALQVSAPRPGCRGHLRWQLFIDGRPERFDTRVPASVGVHTVRLGFEGNWPGTKASGALSFELALDECTELEVALSASAAACLDAALPALLPDRLGALVEQAGRARPESGPRSSRLKTGVIPRGATVA